MSEKKVTISKKSLAEFNRVFSVVKVKGLEQQPCIEYLTLKVKVTDEIEKIEKSRQDAVKAVMAEFNLKEGDNIPKEKVGDFNEKLGGVLDKLFSEKVEIDTHVLTADELFKCILDIEENKDLTTEDKAGLMKYLLK